MDFPDDAPSDETLRTAVQALHEANTRFSIADRIRVRQGRQWRLVAAVSVGLNVALLAIHFGWPLWISTALSVIIASVLVILIDRRADRAIWAKRNPGA